MCRTWYEVGGEDGMKLGMNKAKIFGRQFSWPLMISMTMDIDFSFYPHGDC